MVVGGGNVAYDVARTAVRQKGVTSTALVCLGDFDHMLADKIEIDEGEEEGIERLNSFGRTGSTWTTGDPFGHCSSRRSSPSSTAKEIQSPVWRVRTP